MLQRSSLLVSAEISLSWSLQSPQGSLIVFQNRIKLSILTFFKLYYLRRNCPEAAKPAATSEARCLLASAEIARRLQSLLQRSLLLVSAEIIRSVQSLLQQSPLFASAEIAWSLQSLLQRRPLLVSAEIGGPKPAATSESCCLRA